MAIEALYLDKRLHEKSLRDGKLVRGELEKQLEALEDRSDNMLEFDDEGNPTNEVERELKSLELKTAEPELYKIEEDLDTLPGVIGGGEFGGL